MLGKVAMQTLLLNYYNILLIENTVNDFFSASTPDITRLTDLSFITMDKNNNLWVDLND